MADVALAHAICANARQRMSGQAITPRAMPDDWRDWLKTYAPQTFTGSFADFHIEFWDWYWKITRKRFAGLPLTDEEMVFLAIWARGQGKSSNVEWAAITEGAWIGRGYVLYVSGTHRQAKDHILSIRERIETENVAARFSHLGQPKVGKFGNQYGWSQDILITDGGWAIRPLGLDEGVRGGKVGETRPTLIILDDVDNHSDSPLVVEKKLDTIARSIIPAGGKETIILGAQNLIHRNSVFTQIVERRTSVLSKRVVSGPYPAFRGLELELRHEEDGPRHIIVGGLPTWKDIDLAACQKYLDDSGRDAFLAEYQHDFSARATGSVFPEWDELYHVITWSEFVRFFGREACGCQVEHDAEAPCHAPHIPFTWNLGRGMDWGTTPDHPCVTVWAARPTGRHALNDSVFIYRELCRPYFPPKSLGKHYLVNPRRIAEEILAAERRWEETGRITMSILSHEASATQNTFLDPDEPEFNRLRFVKHKATDRLAGVPQIQNALQIDHSKPHPFRRHSTTGGALMGRPRLYVIVADGQGEIFQSESGWKVRGGIEERGCARLRWEFPRYHYPQNAAGEERDKPLKRDDDGIDSLKHLANVFFPRRKPKTRDELIEEQLHPNYRMDHLQGASPEEWDALYPNRQAAIKEIERAERPGRGDSFYDNDENGRITKSDLDMI